MVWLLALIAWDASMSFSDVSVYYRVTRIVYRVSLHVGEEMVARISLFWVPTKIRASEAGVQI